MSRQAHYLSNASLCLRLVARNPYSYFQWAQNASWTHLCSPDAIHDIVQECDRNRRQQSKLSTVPEWTNFASHNCVPRINKVSIERTTLFGTKIGRYLNTYNAIPQHVRFSEVCYTVHEWVNYCRRNFAYPADLCGWQFSWRIELWWLKLVSLSKRLLLRMPEEFCSWALKKNPNSKWICKYSRLNMHSIIVGHGTLKSALYALHMRSTKIGRYVNTYNAIPQHIRFSEVSYTGNTWVTWNFAYAGDLYVWRFCWRIEYRWLKLPSQSKQLRLRMTAEFSQLSNEKPNAIP